MFDMTTVTKTIFFFKYIYLKLNTANVKNTVPLVNPIFDADKEAKLVVIS